MSSYRTYFIGRKNAEGKIDAGVCFNSKGEWIPAVSTSRSFSSNLWDEMNFLNKKDLTERARKTILGTEEDEDYNPDIRYLDMKDMPNAERYKEGLYPVESIADYEKDIEDRVYGEIRPVIYAAMPEEEKKQYAWYRYEDIYSNEFTSAQISDIFEALRGSEENGWKDDGWCVVYIEW